MAKSTTIIKLSTGEVLTTKDDTAFPLTFSISEIRDISKKRGTFSKSITLPGTKTNNIILNNYYDVNVKAGTFNIDTITNCSVEQNGVTILDNAILQLISVDKKQTNNNHEQEVTYSVLVKDGTSDFYTTLGNKELTDIARLDTVLHNLSSENVIGSFDNTYLDVIKYVMPYKNATNAGAQFSLKHFQPGIYAKIYMDSIFGDAGYSYKWDEQFDELVGFDKLIIPYNGDLPKTTQEDEADFLVRVQKTVPYSVNNAIAAIQDKFGTFGNIASPTEDRLTFPIELQDNQGLWNTTTSRYLTPNIPSNTVITVQFEVDYDVRVINPQAFPVYLNSFLRQGSNAPIESKSNLVLTPTFNIKQNPNKDAVDTTLGFSVVGSVAPMQHVITDGTAFPVGTTIISAGTVSVAATCEGITPNSLIQIHQKFNIDKSEANSNIYTAFYGTSNPAYNATSYGNVRIQYNITGIRMNIVSLREIDYGFGVPVRLKNFIPKKIKQSDFVSSIFKMYNLYCEVDRDNPRQLNLKTRDLYYDQGNVVDWSSKLVKDQEQDLKFLPELQSKKLILTYKQDTTPENVQYFNAVGEIYGQTEFTFDNEYTRGEQKQELIFSPSPMFNTDFGTVNPLWEGMAPKTGIRILYDGGPLPCQQYTIIDGYYQIGATGFTPTTSMVYPHISHWNKPFNPTFDLCFSPCDYYYRSDDFGSLTNNNLFNLFWRRTLNQINTGKLLTALFHLNEIDIHKMRLSDRIRIDNSWWNINKIQDYDSNSVGPTKVELISIDDRLNIPFRERVVNIVRPTIRNRPIRPISWEDMFNNNLVPTPWPIPIRGEWNVLGPRASDGFIFGDRNYFSDISFILGNDNASTGKRATIIGNNNQVTADGLEDVFIVGNNISATTSNTAFFSNAAIIGNLNGVPIDTIATIKFPDTGAIIYGGAFPSGTTGVTISPCIGYIADCESNPTAVTQTKIIYTGQTGIPVPTLSSGTSSYILLGKGEPNPPVEGEEASYAGEIFFQNSFPTSAERKEKIWLSKIGHANGLVTIVVDEVDYLNSPLAFSRDFFQVFNYINDGIYAYANTGLTFNITAGNVHGNGINYVDDNTNPNELGVGPIITTPFVYRTQTGGTSGFVTVLDPANYDAGGIITPVGGGVNSSTIQYIFLAPGAGFLIQYGQQTYTSLADAIANVGKENLVLFSNLVNNAILVSVVVMTRNATNVLDPTQCQFFRADKLGQIIGAAGGSGISTLQTSYNNSLPPQIILNSTLGALQIQGYAGIPSTPSFQVLSTAGTPSFTVSEVGRITGSTISLISPSGTTSGTSVMRVFNSAGTTTFNVNAAGNMSASTITGTQITSSYVTPFAHAHDGAIILGNPTGGGNIAMGVSTDGMLRVKTNAIGLDILNGTNELILGGASRASINAFNSSLYFYVGSIERGEWDSGGRLRIGNAATGTSATKLEVSGGTRIFGGLTADTISATTYFNLPISAVSGLTYSLSSSGTPNYLPVFVSGTTVANSRLFQNLTQGIWSTHGAQNSLLAGNSVFSFQRSQCQIDIVLGNDDISQFNEIWSNNDDGLSIKSLGILNILTGPSYVEGLTINTSGNTGLGMSASTGNVRLQVSGGTRIFGGLTADTISATTYLNVPFWSGGTGTDSIVQKVATNRPTATGQRALAGGWNSQSNGFASFAWGDTVIVSNDGGAAFGASTEANGQNSFAQGFTSIAQGYASHAEGNNTLAGGIHSHAEGESTVASGDSSHAEGLSTLARGDWSHAEGRDTQATGQTAHAEGFGSFAYGDFSHAEGSFTQALGFGSHSEGSSSIAYDLSHAEGNSCIASGTSSHAEGDTTIAGGDGSHSEGFSTEALGQSSHAEGEETIATATASHSEGFSTEARGFASHAEGELTKARGYASHAEGSDTLAGGVYSHAEGSLTIASGLSSHAEGEITLALGTASHAEGRDTEAIGDWSHAQGRNTTASGLYSHAGGFNSIAAGSSSFAHGTTATAYGNNNVAMGELVVTSGSGSVAFGVSTRVTGTTSLVMGTSNTINGDYGAVFGQSNSIQINAQGAFIAGVQNSVIANYATAIGTQNAAFGTSSLAMGQNSQTLYFGQLETGGAGNQGNIGYVDMYGTGNTATLNTHEIGIGGVAGQRFQITEGVAMVFDIDMVVKRTSDLASKEFKVRGLIKTTGSTTTLVGSASTSSFGDSALSAVTISLSASSVDNALYIWGNGIAATPLEYYGNMRYTKIKA